MSAIVVKNKRRGFKFERKIQELLAKNGIPTNRAWGSDGRSLQQDERVDLYSPDTTIGPLSWQCKKVKKIPEKYSLEGYDVLVTGEDRKPEIVVLRLEMLLKLLERK